MNKNVQLQTRASSRDTEKIDAAAERLGVTRAAFLRLAAIERAERELASYEARRLPREGHAVK